MDAPAGVPVASGGTLLGVLALAVLGLESAYRRQGEGPRDGGGEERTTPGETLRAVAVAALFGLGGFLAIYFWLLLLGSLARGLLGSLSTLQETAVLQASNGLGTVTGALLYLEFADLDRSFLDLRRPTLRDAGYVVAGLVVVSATFVGVSLAMSALGVESAAHGTSETLAEAANPAAVAALFAVTSVLVIGPGEELLYRNVVQKSLYGTLSRPAAIVVASVVFAAVHFPAYLTGTVRAALLSLLVVFGLSLTLGAVYERTDSVLVPAAVHGLFNAGQFALIAYDRGVFTGAVARTAEAVVGLAPVLPA